MQFIGTSKIGTLSAKGIAYPQLGSSLEYSDVVGQLADIIETEHGGKRASLVAPIDSTALKPRTEVSKLETEEGANDQINKLQSA